MALKTCNPELEVNARLEPPECECFYHNMKHVVWIVKAVLPTGDEVFSTGLCVHKDGYILTSAFCLRGARTILVRSWKGVGFAVAATRVGSIENDAGVTLLKVDHNEECDHAKFADDDTGITPLREVYGIAHPGKMCFTFLMGKLVREAKGEGDVDIREDGFELICLTDFYGSSKESLGAPVLNSRGYIIGMLVANSRGFDFAVPASHLQQFLQRVLPS